MHDLCNPPTLIHSVLNLTPATPDSVFTSSPRSTTDFPRYQYAAAAATESSSSPSPPGRIRSNTASSYTTNGYRSRGSSSVGQGSSVATWTMRERSTSSLSQQQSARNGGYARSGGLAA